MKVEDMKELDQIRYDGLKEIGCMANEYLEKYCHPHTVIEINEDGIKLSENLVFIPSDEIKHGDRNESCQ